MVMVIATYAGGAEVAQMNLFNPAVPVWACLALIAASFIAAVLETMSEVRLAKKAKKQVDADE